MSEKKTKAEQFIDDIDAVCQQYGLSLSHEDTQGAFIIDPYSLENIIWLRQAALSKVCKYKKCTYYSKDAQVYCCGACAGDAYDADRLGR